MLEPDDQKFEPQLQTEADRGGIGSPPRKTAVGLGNDGSDEEPGSGPTITLNWWQRSLTKIMMFLLGVNPKIDKDNN